MDRRAIEELFAYTDYAWRQYADTVRPLGDEALVKPGPGSGWPALRDALAHLNFAYDKWLAELTGTAMTGFDAKSVSTWDDLEVDRQHVRRRFRQYLDSQSDAELTSRREMNIGGEKLSYSPADLLANVLLHEREHHGDINTLLYQIGVEAPQTAYRFFLLEAARA